MKNVINKHKSNKIKENSNTVRHLNNGTDHRHSKSCCDQSSPARRTIRAQYANTVYPTNYARGSHLVWVVILQFYVSPEALLESGYHIISPVPEKRSWNMF